MDKNQEKQIKEIMTNKQSKELKDTALDFQFSPPVHPNNLSQLLGDLIATMKKYNLSKMSMTLLKKWQDPDQTKTPQTTK